MRDSVARRQSEMSDGRRRLVRRLMLYLGALLVAAGLGGWLWWSDAQMDERVASIREDMKRADAEHAILIERLKRERIEREKRENQAVRDLIYRRTLDGYMTPPKLTDVRCNYLREHNDPARADVIASKEYCLDPLGFEPELTTIGSATIATIAADDYQQLLAGAQQAGHTLDVTSSYRSYSTQVTTYLYWLQTEGRAAADAASAFPGYSEHQTGLAVDFAVGGCALQCFGDTTAYSWLKANAHKHGWIERYPAGQQSTTGYIHEPWHWRYVGKEVAASLFESKAKTLEEHWGLLR